MSLCIKKVEFTSAGRGLSVANAQFERDRRLPVYANFFSNAMHLNIEAAGGKDLTLSLFDLSGQLVDQQERGRGRVFYFWSMRIDKFLWAVRKYKTRTLASEQVKKERVLVNGEKVKPSREVKKSDQISYHKNGVYYRLKVLDFPKSRVGAPLVDNFIRDTTTEEELAKAEFLKMAHKLNRPKGQGRPTKKERRDLDDFRGF